MKCAMSATDNDLERHFGELQAHAASMLLDSQAGVDGGCLSDTDSDISATELSRRQLRNKRLSPHAREDLRLRINCRERQRMHDLNMAMDSLRQVTELKLLLYYGTDGPVYVNDVLLWKVFCRFPHNQ